MNDSQHFGFAKLVPGFDFLQNLSQGTAPTLPQMPSLSSWVAPTLDVDELEKRIQELRAVHFWLDQNSKALGATIHTTARKIAADDFFQGMFTTALKEDELITAISFPIPQRAAYMKFKQQASRFAMVGVFVAQFPSGARVAVTGASSNGVFRPADLEQALSQSFTAEAAAKVKISADGLRRPRSI